jgi:hypothetical protein
MSYIPRFIKIYAGHKADDVKLNPVILETAFEKSLEDLSVLPGFSVQQEFVRSLKEEIEADHALYDLPDNKEQIQACLKALMRVAVYDESAQSTVVEKVRTLRRLFIRLYSQAGTKWTRAQLRHVWFVSERLAAWHTYFLSYTNSGSTIVNDDYESVILKFADPKVRKGRNPDEDNILVDAMVHWFERKKLSHRSFYDKKKIEAGDYLEEAIAPAIKNTLAFVQLIQLDTFNTKGKVNWSFEEYEIFRRCTEAMLEDREHYRSALETRFIAVLAGEPEKLELDDFKLPPKYRPWKKHIFTTARRLTLPTDKLQFDVRMEELESAIIHRAYNIIESVPA